MPEVASPNEETVVQNKPEVKQIASIGKVQRVNNVSQNENAPRGTIDNKTAPSEKEDIIVGKAPETTKIEKPQIDESILKDYLESQGIKYEGLDKLKEKVNYTPAVELTEEEKTKAQLAREKRAVDLFVKNGGKIEDYVAIKKIAEADLKELSIANTKDELKKAGFSDDKIAQILKDRYYQFEDDEIEQEEDESDKDFKKRAKEYFSKKLENRSAFTKSQAKSVLENLNKAIESEDSQAKQEVEISAKIDDYFKAQPRKVNFEIGEVNGQKIAPVEYEVSETDLSKVQKFLKTPAEVNKFFYNQDGSLNLPNISNLLIKNAYLESALKAAYHEGGSRQVAEFKKVFPSSAAELGIGGAPKDLTAKKQVASFGKPQKVSR
jgi:hypothetical protein